MLTRDWKLTRDSLKIQLRSIKKSIKIYSPLLIRGEEALDGYQDGCTQLAPCGLTHTRQKDTKV